MVVKKVKIKVFTFDSCSHVSVLYRCVCKHMKAMEFEARNTPEGEIKGKEVLGEIFVVLLVIFYQSSSIFV